MYLRTYQYDDALNDANALILYDSSDFSSWNIRGIVLLEIGSENLRNNNTMAAIRDFSQAILLAPNKSRAYHLRSKAYYELSLNKAALADVNLAISLDSQSNYFATRSMIYRNQEKPDLALDDLNKAIELDPQNIEAYLNRGYLREGILDDKKGAELDFAKAKELGFEGL